MRTLFELAQLRRTLRRGLSGPQMLAFLPALCLAAYWGGGEVLLVLCALTTPLVYAAFGGFGRWFDRPEGHDSGGPSLERVAQDFLEIARHNGQTTACFRIALPELDRIGERYGPDTAAETRNLIASRLRTMLRGSDHVFSDGNSRFIVLISPGFRVRLDNLLDLGKRLCANAESPVSIAGTTHTLPVCIGIASSLNFGRNVTASSWLTSASAALDEALMSGPGTMRLWSDRLARQHRSRRDASDRISEALDEGAIQAYFQPQFHIRTDETTGVEVFARWIDAERGTLATSEFLNAARDSGQLPRLGRTMFLQAVTARVAWDKAGLQVDTISLNLSDAELRDPDLCTRLSGDLDRCGFPAHRLILEIAEQTLMDWSGDDMLRRNILGLVELGCRFDLDEFGAGTTSLAILRELPISRVKLHSLLIKGIEASDDSRRTVDAILGLCDRLELPVVATGIETHQQLGVIRDLGCAFGQGFLFAAPMDCAQMHQWLSERQQAKQAANGARIQRIK